MDERSAELTGIDAATEAVMQSMRTQMGHSCPDPMTARIYAREFAKAALRSTGAGRSEAEAMRERYIAGRMDMRDDAADAVNNMAVDRIPRLDHLARAALAEAVMTVRALPLEIIRALPAQNTGGAGE